MADPYRPWRAAWSEALYGAGGFYRRSEGPAGHFETSANAPGGEVAALAGALARLARRHDCRRVVDVGAGRGELLSAMAEVSAADDEHLDLLGVDVVARPGGLPERVGWLESPGGGELPAALGDVGALDRALVVAHEWLDVVPCDVLEVDDRGAPRVVEVNGRGEERLGDVAGPALGGWCERWWPVDRSTPGARIEVGAARDAAFADLLGRVRSGVVVAVDYGHTAPDRPPYGTLAGHRAGRLVPPVPDGRCDLTAHVAWDSVLAVAPGASLSTQREALLGLGVDGRRPALAPGHPSYLAELQRASAAATLLDPGGLGSLGWLVCVVPHPGIGQPEPTPARLEP